VVPELLKHGPAPSLSRRRLFYGIAVAVLAVGRQRVAHVQIRIGDAPFSVNLNTIFHPATPCPTVLNDSLGAVFEVEDANTVVLAPSLVLVDVCSHVTEDALDGGSAEEPVAERDPVTAHVHKHTAPG